MNEDFNSKIEQLKDMLNNDQLPENLKNIMSQFSNNSNTHHDSMNNSSLNENADTIALISKVKNILDKKNRIEDPRINLLKAMKPYLCSKRQEKIESCIKILNLALITNMLKDENL